MNLLQLVNRTRVECGVSGPALATLVGVSGESARILGWVQQAWTELQTLKDDWQWMQSSFGFNLTPMGTTFTPGNDVGLADFGRWKLDSFRCSTDNTYFDEQPLDYLEWQPFRDHFWYGTARSTFSRPTVFTVTPSKALSFGPAPDLDYYVNGEYFTAPTELALDADTPGIPAASHMLLVYAAMIFYAGYEAAPEVLARGDAGYKRLLGQLENDQLPTIISGPPLA